MEYRVVPRSSKRITQKYKPLTHKGVDIGWSSVEENHKVHANCRGIVREVVDGKTNNTKSTGAASWGNYVLVEHPNGYYTRYAHLKKGAMVKVGQVVDESTVVGIMGDSGKAYGRHLHFEVATGYSSTKRINPTPYLTEPVYDEAPTPTPTPTPEPTPAPTAISAGDLVIVNGRGNATSSGKSRAWTRTYKDKTMKVIMIAKGAAYPYACNQYAKGTVGKATDVTAWFKEADVKKFK